MGPSVRESSLDMAELPDHHETRCVPNTEQERRRCRASRERPCVGELSAKRLELIKEVVPGANRVAVLCDPTVPDTAPTVNRVREAAQALGVQLRIWEIRDPAELEKAFVAVSSERLGALLVLPDILLNQYRQRIVQLANNNRMSAVYPLREHVEAGGLMFYGATFREMYRRAASHVDKILKGAKPGDLPVEQPTKFELVINLKTAKALGLTIPRSEEHTSELQSLRHLVCRLLLEKKKKMNNTQQ